MKRVRVVLLGLGSSTGVKKPKAGLIELPEMVLRQILILTCRSLWSTPLTTWSRMPWSRLC